MLLFVKFAIILRGHICLAESCDILSFKRIRTRNNLVPRFLFLPVARKDGKEESWERGWTRNWHDQQNEMACRDTAPLKRNI